VRQLDAADCHRVWREVIADERLFEALLDRHPVPRPPVPLMRPGDDAILETLAADTAALRWNVLNLRFRASLDTMLKLRRWMPLTTCLLTAGHDDWLQDLCYEYLSRHRWDDLGHRHFAECRRFTAFIEDQVRGRRTLPDHFETVLAYEASVCAMLEESAHVPDAAWGPEIDPGGPIGTRRPRPGPLTRLLELPVDITAWITAGAPTEDEVGAGPLTLLAFVPRREETFWVIPLDANQQLVFERCSGRTTAGQIAGALERQAAFHAPDVLALVGAWVRHGALALD